jgi:Secretion system C-terminal sorting domain
MYRLIFSILILIAQQANSQTPITPNPLQPFDKYTVSGVDIGINGLLHNKRVNSDRVITYVTYAPFTSIFGIDYFAYDQFTNGNYGKLSIKDNHLVDVYTWNTSEIFNTLHYRVLGCWNVDVRDDKISVLVAANTSTTPGFANLFMGLLQFDTTLTLLSAKWFPDPYDGDYSSSINVIKLKNGNYLKYGKRYPSELTVAEFDTSGQSVLVKPITTGDAVGGGGNIQIMPSGAFALNPGFILDSNYQTIATYGKGYDTNRSYFGSIVPIDSQRFIYGTTTMYYAGAQKFALQMLATVDLKGKEDTFFRQEQNITQFGLMYNIRAGLRAIETTDTSQIFFAFRKGTGLTSDIVVSSIKLDGILNWSRSFGGGSLYHPIDFIRTPSAQYHLIVARQYDTSWIDPQGYAFPKTEFLYVTFDTLGNVVSISSDSEPAQNQRLLVYPNPASDMVFFEDFGQFTHFDVEFFDSSGRIVLKETLNNKCLDINGLIGGMYFYRVFDESKNLIQTGKLIVSK